MKNITLHFTTLMLAVTLVSSMSYGQNANTALSNLTSPTAVNIDFLPNGNNKKNLGSVAKSWKALYLDSIIYLRDSLFLHNKGVQNSFTGERAGTSITTGTANSGFGFHSLFSNTTGVYNSAFGSLALANNNASYNSAFGYRALNQNTSGIGNTASGNNALYSNTTGNYNVAMGYFTMYNNNTGEQNIAIGNQALYKNTIGSYNTAFGMYALYYNSTANYNSAFGHQALKDNTTGQYNTANGAFALCGNGVGVENTASGYYALVYVSSGHGNTGVGSNALSFVTSDSYNTAIGYHAGDYRKGSYNTFVGTNAFANTDGYFNSTAIGYQASMTASNQVRIGNYNVTSIGGKVDWTTLSDGRVKKNIKQNVPGLSFINKLNPVTYNLDLVATDNITQTAALKDRNGNAIKLSEQDIAARKAKEQIIYTGLIAQEVEKTAKEAGFDFSGVDAAKNEHDLYGLRYSEFVMPLIKAVQELSKQNEEQQKQIDELRNLIKRTAQVASATGQQLITAAQSPRLEQNQPNPASSTTAIKYFVPEQISKAVITITNPKGHEMKSISIPAKSNGQISLQTNGLSAGTYFYSLIVDGKMADTKKMVIVN